MTTESVLILSGIGLFLLSVVNDKIKFMDSELPELSQGAKTVAKILAVVLLLSGLATYFYKMKVEAEKIIPPKPQIRLSEHNVQKMFISRGYSEVREFPVTPEIISAVHDGYSSYQTRICERKANDLVLVPQDFKECPYGSDSVKIKPFLGPSLNLTFFIK